MGEGQNQNWGARGTCVWVRPSASPALPLPAPLQVTTQHAWPGAGQLGVVNGSANVLGVWGLFRVRVWVSASEVTVGVESGKLGVGKTLTFGAVKGCPGMAGLGA